jgi:histidinol dehydrogenase
MKKIVLQWMQETARQRQQINQVRLKQAKRRSLLECAMGWTALALFVIIAAAAIYILLNPEKFPDTIVSFTVPALVADILGTLNFMKGLRNSALTKQ